MKFKFDAHQDFQLEAVNAIADIFEGQPRNQGTDIRNLTVHVDKPDLFMAEGYGVYGNVLSLSEEELLENMRNVQERNGVKSEPSEDRDYSIEMETGTGKTYVYLRTVFELNKRYGWKKFIVLVPSVAIREGVIKTLEITKEHFKELYDGVPCSFYEYQSKNISQVKRFADSSTINIMVMTVGAFNRDENVLYATRDQMQGEQPIAYIQRTNPILILDEPQNMEGAATREALKNFNALFRLRYSATHKNPHNLMYQLTPFDAYQLGLVKKIEVLSVTDDETGASRPMLNVISVEAGATVKARVEILAKDTSGAIKKKKLSVKKGDDLAKKTSNDAYEGFVVEGMDADVPEMGRVGKISFRNGVEVRQGETVGGNHEEIMREQIEQTVRLHFEKRANLRKLGIKPLTLFFIDKVANYIENEGFIRTTFMAEVERLKNEFDLNDLDTNALHKGYFAKRGDTYLERETAIAENQEAYELIMKDKERLLSFEEPTEFIFSHSALKEGWDNPNVFNICTLRETASPMRKRQEIGRGMRLCVNQDGERVFATHINLLSVVANQSYSQYVSELQQEFKEDGIYSHPPAPHNARRRRVAKLKKDFEKDAHFAAVWDRISRKTRYIVRVDSERLVENAAKKIEALQIEKPTIRLERRVLDLTKERVSGRMFSDNETALRQTKRSIDCIELIKEETKLTRKTVAQILARAGNTTAFLNNPERFCFEVVRIIKSELIKGYVEQIRYEVLPEQFDLAQFENIPAYKDATHPVNNSIYDAVVFDSEVEKSFALDLDSDERVKLFIKLPNWFRVETPLGGYTPDWAIVTAKRDLGGREGVERLYFVIETKGDLANLRPAEQAKIDSAREHFKVIEVNYKEVESYDQFARELR